jgi:signal peptidase I
VTVPAGHYFMMGDNRDDSQDSRFWGFLPESYVKGRALFIYWSFDVPDDGSRGGFAPRWARLFHQIH